jgi:uncharacterized low-complexity protein
MSNKTVIKPLVVALSTAFIGSIAGTSVANADVNPFGMTQLSSGYMVADSHEMKCGEGKCGGSKGKKEGKCGEGKCGMSSMDADGDGKVTKDEFMAGHEKKFAAKDKNSDGVLDAKEMEGKCGEGKCGGDKTKKEGKCGEGKCGGSK